MLGGVIHRTLHDVFDVVGGGGLLLEHAFDVIIPNTDEGAVALPEAGLVELLRGLAPLLLLEQAIQSPWFVVFKLFR